MTTDQTLQQRRNAAYSERARQLRLRGALLEGAASAGADPDGPLPAALAAVHASYSARIHDLNVVIADLDRRIAEDDR
ncbi:hypothetical protein ACRU44_23565 [Mycobacterium colombiense]